MTKRDHGKKILFVITAILIYFCITAGDCRAMMVEGKGGSVPYKEEIYKSDAEAEEAAVQEQGRDADTPRAKRRPFEAIAAEEAVGVESGHDALNDANTKSQQGPRGDKPLIAVLPYLIIFCLCWGLYKLEMYLREKNKKKEIEIEKEKEKEDMAQSRNVNQKWHDDINHNARVYYLE